MGTVKMKGTTERIGKTGRMREITERRGPPVKMKGIIVKTKGTTAKMKETTVKMKETTVKMKGIIERMRLGRKGPPVKMKETTGRTKETIGRMKETTENIGKTERMRGITETIGIIWSKHKDASTHFGNNLYTIMSAIRFSNVCNIFLLVQISFSSSVDKQ